MTVWVKRCDSVAPLRDGEETLTDAKMSRMRLVPGASIASSGRLRSGAQVIQHRTAIAQVAVGNPGGEEETISLRATMGHGQGVMAVSPNEKVPLIMCGRV